MTDVTQAIAPKSDQLNADDLLTGPKTIKIKDVKVNTTADQPIWVHYEGDGGKPWKPCKSAARVLATVWGSNSSQWIGLSCTLYNDPSVTWAGLAVGGIRVSHMEGLDKPKSLMLTKTRGKKASVTIKPLASNETPTKPTKDGKQSARDAASKGKSAFTEWWNDNPDLRDSVKPIMDELKSSCSNADAINDEDVPI